MGIAVFLRCRRARKPHWTEGFNYSASYPRLLLDGFENADNMLNQSEFLEQRGDSRGWLTYNMARCKFGLADFEQPLNCTTKPST